MAVNNDFKYVGLTGTTWYVSAYHGDDGNSGTAIDPFASKTQAETVASPGDTIVIGSGYYKEERANNASYRYLGEGIVIIEQPVGPTVNALPDETLYCENITFYLWNSTAVVKHGTSQPVPIFVNCNFIDCTIQAGDSSSFGYYMGCTFDTCTFDTNGTPELSPSAYGIINCVFRECSGTLLALEDFIYGVYNNHFTECDGLSFGIAPGQPISKFDFNNIENGLNGYLNNAAIQADGFNANGSGFSSSDIFVDYDPFRTTGQWYLQNFTQKQTSPLGPSKSNSIISRYNKSISYDAVTIWNASIDDNNLSLVVDQIQLNALQSNGFIQIEPDLGSVKNINLVKVVQEIVWNIGTGRGEQLADHLADNITDFKGTYDIFVEYKVNAPDAYLPANVEYDKYIVDRLPQIITARYLRITLTLRNYTI